MNKKIDIEAAHEAAIDLAGALEHIGSLHAALAAKDKREKESAAIAAMMAVLQGQAERLANMLMQ